MGNRKGIIRISVVIAFIAADYRQRSGSKAWLIQRMIASVTSKI
jgi:hypothetical protein